VRCVRSLNKAEIRHSESNCTGNFSITGRHVFIQNSGRANTSKGVSILVNQPAIDFITTYSTHASCFRLTEEMTGDQLKLIIQENLDETSGDITGPFKGSAAETEHVILHNHVQLIITPLTFATSVKGCLVE
jgi:hypothetical protein